MTNTCLPYQQTHTIDSVVEQGGSVSAPRKGIVWLASYPKSGNTWTRIFFRNLLNEKEEGTALDEIGFAHAAARSAFDRSAGIDSSDLTEDEIDLLRPQVYQDLVEETEQFPVLMKTHDAWTYLPNGEPLLSQTATATAILLIRNPLDVAVSYAFHGGKRDFDHTIKIMAAASDSLSRTRRGLNNQLRQQMLGWSGFADSWLKSGVPFQVLRYEDMKERPLESFTAATRFAGLGHTQSQIKIAIDQSRFEHLQKREQENGFREKMEGCNAFFRKGQVGSWREELSKEQAQRIVDQHFDMMQHFGYVHDDGTPVY